jgi:hypothetical protein
MFPLAVEGFRRGVVQRYDQEGLDLSAGYDLYDPSHKIAATVYVYPAPLLVSIGSSPEVVAIAHARLAKNEFEARKREILQSHPGSRLIEESDVSISNGAGAKAGKMATFEYNGLFASERQALKSHLYMFNFVGGKWALKYRITYPQFFDATKDVEAILKGVPSSVPGQ